MSFTFYEATVPLLTRGLTSLSHILEKAEANETTTAADLSSGRLVEDMLPLTFQVHMTTDTAAKVVHRVQGTEPLDWSSSDLTDFASMRARVEAALAIVAKADAAVFGERVDATVPLMLGKGKKVELKAKEYAIGYGLPNFFFHMTTAYAILRMKGVPLGKTDYLAAFMGPYTQQL